MQPGGSASIVAALPGHHNAHVACLGDKLYLSVILNDEVYEVTTDGCTSFASLAFPNGMTTDTTGNFLYSNNLVGVMGGPRGQIRARAIHLDRAASSTPIDWAGHRRSGWEEHVTGE